MNDFNGNSYVQIKETTTIKYVVMIGNTSLSENATQNLAEQFITTLLPEQREQARVVPVTESGQQVLFG